MPDVDHDLLARWLHIYEDAPGHISLTAFKDGRNQSHHYTTDTDGIAAAMQQANRLCNDGYDVYMRTTTVDADALEDYERGGGEHTVAVVGVGTDLDHQQGAHKRTDLPPTPQDALSLVEGMPQPSIIINSGGGFYAWWLFEQPCEDLDVAAPLLKAWNDHVVAKAAQKGWHVDQVGDLPRILRPVGTWSYKTDQPKPVVVHEHTGKRYRPDQLQTWLDKHGIRPEQDPPKTLPRPSGFDNSDDLTGKIKRTWTVEQELAVRSIDVPAKGVISCPFPDHDDRTPSFHIYDDPQDGWACFGSSCPSSGGGSVIDLVMHLDGVDVGQAIRQLAHRIGHPAPAPSSPHLVDMPASPNGHTPQDNRPSPQTATAVPLDPADLDPSNPLHAAVWHEYQRIVARDHAYKIRDAATAPDPPDFIRLDRMLNRPLDPVTYRIVGLWPSRGRVMLVAQFKAGKTTLVGNVVRSLVDGIPFLGQYPTSPLDDGRTVAIIDDELDDQTLQRWYDEQGIGNTERAHVVCLRGKTSTFDITNDAVRAHWADKLRAVGAQVVMFDCLRPILDALGLSEHTDAGILLNAFDELCDQAGIDEAIVVHHMGHDAERGRGDSRLRDWPDAEWKIVRDVEKGEDDPDAPRYFSAYGRDVNEKERRLELSGRTLTLSGCDRKTEKKKGDALTLVARLQEHGQPVSQSELMRACGWGDRKVKRVVEDAMAFGWVSRQDADGALIHTLTPKGEMA